jgi:hypothetical protein
MTNETKLKEQNGYYKEMRKISLVHTVFSSITTLAGFNTFLYIAPFTAPISVPFTVCSIFYGGYHMYMNYKSTHIEQVTEFYLHEDKYDSRFEPTWQEKITIPEFLFNPVVFFVLVYLFTFFLYFFREKFQFVSFLKVDSLSLKILLTILFYLFIFLVFLYTFSFAQCIKESNTLILEKRSLKKREIKHKCHVLRMTFWQKVHHWIFGFFKIQTDKMGYVINEECIELELELYKINEPLINIFYRTFTRSYLVILNEILNSLSSLNKLFIISLIVLAIFIFIKKKYINDRKTKTY